jgi:toxin ParE1/3/4
VNNKPWQVRKGPAANADFANILRWTMHHFGKDQTRIYAKTLGAALRDLRAGPHIIGSKPCIDVAEDIYTLHVARRGHPGRHLVVFRANSAHHQIDILRILHDSMDLTRHLSLH